MTEEQERMPRGMLMPTHALETGDDAGTDLFAWTPENAATPHPNFTARAAIWRDQRAGLISIAEAQRRSRVVARAGADDDPRRDDPVGRRGSGGLGRAEHPRQGRVVPERGDEQFAVVLAVGRAPVALRCHAVALDQQVHIVEPEWMSLSETDETTSTLRVAPNETTAGQPGCSSETVTVHISTVASEQSIDAPCDPMSDTHIAIFDRPATGPNEYFVVKVEVGDTILSTRPRARGTSVGTHFTAWLEPPVAPQPEQPEPPVEVVPPAPGESLPPLPGENLPPLPGEPVEPIEPVPPVETPDPAPTPEEPTQPASENWKGTQEQAEAHFESRDRGEVSALHLKETGEAFDGTITIMLDDGGKRGQVTVVNGLLHGEEILWGDDGNVIERNRYENGKLIEEQIVPQPEKN